ncbi:DUF4138 domain-containing protein [Zunongwangia sp. F363]|uniref:DUF4138 domain-containing protein n=1 Tax=Autumnicola tepida TaxID=3075595 RepID=A0ABU3C785_9FLAO|nr:DUF4138 domain-containing protein [Zunongwangia sp. F363]MDT0642206.1 DUF4138 domain-containing protein [Zunongwangia sp. F363]
MKTLVHLLLVIFILLCSDSIYAQAHRAPDTIYANDHQQVALFFPAPIRQAVTGAPHMVFTYNKDRPQYFGLLQAKAGVVSNLFVIDQQGNIFSFVLKFREELPHFYYFFTGKDAVGREAPLKKDAVATAKAKSSPYLERLSEHFLRRAKGSLRRQKTSGVVLRVKDIVFFNENFFLVMELENSSGISYEPDQLDFYISTKKQGKRKSMQTLPLEILYAHSFPEKVLAGTTDRFVVVLPKFTLPDNKEITTRLFEKHGARNIELKLLKRHINGGSAGK